MYCLCGRNYDKQKYTTSISEYLKIKTDLTIKTYAMLNEIFYNTKYSNSAK